MSRLRRIGTAVLAYAMAGGLSGCLSTVAMHEAVLSYDRTAVQVGGEILLLNIARSRHHHSVHFTAISSVAATFNFQVSAGATPPLGALESGMGLAPVFGGLMSENPTITIIPIEGEEFGKRVLAPIHENKFHMLFEQGTDLGMLLRLMVSEMRLTRGDGQRVFSNRPSRRSEYEEFRRRVLHMVALHRQHKLFLEPIVVEETVTLPLPNQAKAGIVEIIEALKSGFRWKQQGDGAILTRKIGGHILISNYDPDLLPNEDRRKLLDQAILLHDNETLVDIREGFPGGEYPFRGTIRMRSFLGVLQFLAQAVAEEQEYHVEQDPRSGPVPFNPPQALEITESTSKDSDAAISVPYEGKVYSIKQGSDPASVWNLEAFRLLNQLFQLTVSPSELQRTSPSITIAK